MAFNLFAAEPIPLLPTEISGFFVGRDAIPANAETGVYNLFLVLLSYLIVVFASYMALGIASKVPADFAKSQRIKILCGATAMGAGIWSMHFIGMLAYKMRMQLHYNPWITILSMGVAVLFAGAAFWVIRGKVLSNRVILLAAPLMGLAVCGMHYLGMAAMQMDAKLLYVPDLFVLSFLIAVSASAAALKLMYHARVSARPALYNLFAALLMGLAVCGMHYTGMAASVFVPYANCRYVDSQDFSTLALSVSLITLLVIFISYLVRQLDEALIEAKLKTAQLIQAQKMESVGQLTGGIAHDFNNVLNIVIGNLEVLDSLPKIPEEARKVIQAASVNARKANDLTMRLLAFSRNEIVKPERMDIARLLESALELARRALPPSVTLEADIREALPPVTVNSVHFESAILNLVINARDAMPDRSGSIAVRAHAAQPDGAGNAVTKYIAVEVRDNGAGMPPEVLARATEPHFTTKDAGKGSGMGLSMVAEFAKSAGGTVAIASEPGQGTAITIFLPVAP